MKQCNKCQAEIKEEDKFCTSCGAAVEETPIAEPTAESTAVVESEKSIFEEQTSTVENISPADTIGAAPVAASAVTPMATATIPAKKDNKMLFMIIGMVLCILIAIGGVVFAVVSSNKDSGKRKADSGSVADDNNGGNTVSPTVNNDGVRVSLDGHEILVPDGYSYEMDGNALMMIDEGETHMYMVQYNDGIAFSDLYNNVKEYEKQINDSGEYNSVTGGTEKVNGVDIVYFDILDLENDYYSEIFVKKGIYSFEVIVANADFEIDHSLFGKIVDVLSSTNEQTASKALETESVFKKFTLDEKQLGQ